MDLFEKPTFLSRLNEALIDPHLRETRQTQRRIQRTLVNQPSGGEVLELRMKVDQLEDSLLSLGLYTRTILQLLVENGTTTTDAFQERLVELDLLDGKLDGK